MYKCSIMTYTKAQLAQQLAKLGQPDFRAKQLFTWLHSKQVLSFAEMTNLPKSLIVDLDENYYIESLSIARKQTAADGTIKYLFTLGDNNCIETVLMRYHYGNTVCVSTQVGCRMGCKFCASTKCGLVRNLSGAEILSEIYAVMRDTNERVSHIVLMGIGEPLDNYDNVLSFLRNISDDDGANIGMRNISLSTCGIVPQILRLADEKLGLTLSISLHAPYDVMRSGMMPINNAYPLKVLLDACHKYYNITKRRISFEYSMVKGVNDSEDCAKQLAKLIRGLGAHVNLIPINPVDASPYTATDDANVQRFAHLLEQLNVNATIRRRLGAEITAACGQLRHEAAGRDINETCRQD